MKTRVKIIVGLAVAGAAMIAVGNGTGDSPSPCYQENDVRMLMESNGWSRDEATEVLQISCDHAVTPDSE